MFFCFNIWGKEESVEYGVYGPLRRERQFVCHQGYHLLDLKGPMMSRGQFN